MTGKSLAIIAAAFCAGLFARPDTYIGPDIAAVPVADMSLCRQLLFHQTGLPGHKPQLPSTAWFSSTIPNTIGTTTMRVPTVGLIAIRRAGAARGEPAARLVEGT